MLKNFLRLSIFAVLGLSVGHDLYASTTSAIQVRPYTRVFEGDKTTLLDVIDRESLSPDAEKQLAAVTLGDTPKMGEQRVYTNTAIADAIRQTGDKKNWSIKIPRKVVVENLGYQVDRATIERDLIARWQAMCSDCQIRVLTLQLPGVPKWTETVPWSMPVEDATRLPRGHFSQRLNFVNLDGRQQTFWINGQIEVKRQVPVLNRSTPMGTRLTDEDFSSMWRDVTQATDTTPTAKEIIGQQAKFTMNAGDILWRGSLVREKAVRRGEMVKVVTGEGGWEVSLQAQTEQDGFIGDSVNLRNLQTNRVITGRVSAPGEVEIR